VSVRKTYCRSVKIEDEGWGTYLLGDLEFSHLLHHPFLQFICSKTLAFLNDNSNSNILPVMLVFHGEADGLTDGRMLSKNIVQLDRTNFLATLIDQLLNATRD